MINELNIDIGKSDMSFAVTSNKSKDPEIKYSDLRSFFANRRILLAISTIIYYLISIDLILYH
jgi:hypothetical protein